MLLLHQMITGSTKRYNYGICKMKIKAKGWLYAIENLCMGKWQRPEGHKMSVVSRRRNRDTPMMMIMMIGKMMMRMRGMVMRMKMLMMVVMVMVMIMIKRMRMRWMVMK